MTCKVDDTPISVPDETINLALLGDCPVLSKQPALTTARDLAEPALLIHQIITNKKDITLDKYNEEEQALERKRLENQVEPHQIIQEWFRLLTSGNNLFPSFTICIQQTL